MIKAIIFDCFGVLTTDGWLPVKQRLFGHDPALFEKAGELNMRSDTGAIGYQAFLHGVAKLASRPVSEIRHAIENNVANGPLFDYIKTLKPTYKIGLLSNAAENWLDELFSKEQLEPFDAVSLSCESGFVKPDKRAYETIANQLGELPKDCLLIDDQERYCDGARQAGMSAVLYKNLADLKQQLQKVH